MHLVMARAPGRDRDAHLGVLVDQNRTASDYDGGNPIFPGSATATRPLGPAEPQIIGAVENALRGETLFLVRGESTGFLVTCQAADESADQGPAQSGSGHATSYGLKT